MEWPESDSCTTGANGEITVCSVDGHAKLILSSSREEFTAEFTCHSSRNEVQSQYPQLQGHQHRSTCLLSALTSKSADAQMDRPGLDIKSPNAEVLESTSLKSGKWHVYTRVIQQFSRELYPEIWRYSLSLALKHWESLKTKRNTDHGEDREGSTDGKDRQYSQTGRKTPLPKPLPLKCPSPHQHK